MNTIHTDRTLGSIASWCAIVVLSGCAGTPIFHQYSVVGDGATSALIDARQRAVIAAPGPSSSGQNNEWQARSVLVCAEPSPDALSVVSSSFGAAASASGLGESEGAASVAAAIRQAARELGQRNATIQLLRDGLYRQCEAYLNGLITKKEYEALSNRYIDGMVVLLAIERITPDSTRVVELPAPSTAESAARSGAGDDAGSDSDGEEAQGQEGVVGTDVTSSAIVETGAQEDGQTISVMMDNKKQIDEYIINAIRTLTAGFLNKDLMERCLEDDGAGTLDVIERIRALNDKNTEINEKLFGRSEVSDEEKGDLRHELYSNIGKLDSLYRGFEKVADADAYRAGMCDYIVRSIVQPGVATKSDIDGQNIADATAGVLK